MSRTDRESFLAGTVAAAVYNVNRKKNSRALGAWDVLNPLRRKDETPTKIPPLISPAEARARVAAIKERKARQAAHGDHHR